MDDTTTYALMAIIRGIIDGAPDIATGDALTQSIYGMSEELALLQMPTEAGDLRRLGDFARDIRNARI
jgi:hypothetical protein